MGRFRKKLLAAILGARRREGTGGAVPDAGQSTLTAAAFDPDAGAANVHTLTLKSSSGATIPSASVAWSWASVTLAAASDVAVTPSTIPDDNVTVVTIVATLVDSQTGAPMPGIPLLTAAGNGVLCAVSGTGNTLAAVGSVTDADGVGQWTCRSSVAEVKTITISYNARTVTEQPTFTVTGSGAPTIVFASDWGNSTGVTEAAITDGGVWDNHSGGYGDALTVVAGAGLGWTRTTNVLRIAMNGAVDELVIKDNAVAQSTTHYGQVYLYNTEDDPTAYMRHSLTYLPIGGLQISVMGRLPVDASTWKLVFTPAYVSGGGSNAYPNFRWVTTLNSDTWYRFAWQIEYVTASTYKFYPEVYTYDDGNPTDPGTLVASAANFVNQEGVTTLATYQAGASWGVTNAAGARDVGLGQEGQSGAPTPATGYLYAADYAMSTGFPVGT